VIFDAIHDNVATKADVHASEAAVRGELRSEIARLDTKIERLDAKVELIGQRNFNRLGVLAAGVAGLQFAALHVWPPY
jgi:hypothetical protein